MALASISAHVVDRAPQTAASSACVPRGAAVASRLPGGHVKCTEHRLCYRRPLRWRDWGWFMTMRKVLGTMVFMGSVTTGLMLLPSTRSQESGPG